MVLVSGMTCMRSGILHAQSVIACSVQSSASSASAARFRCLLQFADFCVYFFPFPPTPF